MAGILSLRVQTRSQFGDLGFEGVDPLRVFADLPGLFAVAVELLEDVAERGDQAGDVLRVLFQKRREDRGELRRGL